MERTRRLPRPLDALLIGAVLGASSLLLLGAGCDDQVASPEPGTGRNLTVTEGADVVLATGERIHFDKVETDSRCPQGLACFWEGEAKASFSLRPSKNVGTPFTLGITGTLVAADTVQSMQRFQTVVVDRYHLTLLQLDPYPKAGIDPLRVTSKALIRIEY